MPNEPLDLQELSAAARKVGFVGVDVLGSQPRIYWDPHPERECPQDCSVQSWRPEDGENPELSFAFRDAVRKVAPTAVIEMDRGIGKWVQRVDFDWTIDHWQALNGELPHGLPWTEAETECWARALIALDRAGLLEVVGA